MSDLSDDDLPDTGVSQSVPKGPKQNKEVSYHIDLTKEIEQRYHTLEIEKRRKKIEEEERDDIEESIHNIKSQQEVLDDLEIKESVPDEPPGRVFFTHGSFSQFNAETLEIPAVIKGLDSSNIPSSYQRLKNTLKEATSKESEDILKYILLLASVHKDEFFVECCTDVLLEFNKDWELDHVLLLAIFGNWGADIAQALPSFRPFPPRIKSCSDPVPSYNVIAVLNVLSAQLENRKKISKFALVNEGFGYWDVNELVFSLLIILSLDSRYISCSPAIQECMWHLLTTVSERDGSSWVKTYSEVLILLETNNYNLTAIVTRVLFGSTACEALRLNVSFAAIQRLLGVQTTEIKHSFEIYTLKSLVASATQVAKLEPLDIYCLLIFLDTILRHPGAVCQEDLRSFCKWLSKLGRKVGTDSHVDALLALYSDLWDE